MRKKVVITMMAMMLTGVMASAQIVQSHSRLETRIKKLPFEKSFYLSVGGTLNTATDKHFSFTPGFEVALGFERNFKRNRPLGSQWGLELGLTTKGWKYSQLGFDQKMLAPGVFFSPYYSYRIGLGASKKSWIEPHVGPFVCVLFDKDGTYDYQGGNTQYEPSLSVESNIDNDVIGGIDAGLRLWVSRRISLDLSYRLGVAPNLARASVYNSYCTYDGGDWNWHGGDERHEGLSSSVALRVGIRLNK